MVNPHFETFLFGSILLFCCPFCLSKFCFLVYYLPGNTSRVSSAIQQISLMRTVAKTITRWLVNTKAIPSQMSDVFEYGIFSCLFSSMPVLVVILLSIPLGMISESITMIIPFLLLRKFAGGFHFSSPLPCSVTSVALLLICLFGIKTILVFHNYSLISSLVLLSLAFIIIHSPIDSKNRRLTNIEKKIFRKIAISLSIIIAMIFFTLIIFARYSTAIPIGFGIILTAFLQVPCKFAKRTPREM